MLHDFKKDFLKCIGYLDESTFLYCEEAILANQIKQLGKNILFVPSLCAFHAHQASLKDAKHQRRKIFI